MSSRQSRRGGVAFAGGGALVSGFVLLALAVLPSCDSAQEGSQRIPLTKPSEAPQSPVSASSSTASTTEEPASKAAGSAEPKEALTGLDSEYTSAESLARAVLKALRQKDEAELNRLRVTFREYSELLFPHFDAARPPRNVSVELHWKLLDTKSVVGVKDAIQAYGGQEFELLEVLPQGVDEYPTYRLLRKVRLKLRRVSDGAEDTVTIFGSIVEMGSKFKLLSYPS